MSKESNTFEYSSVREKASNMVRQGFAGRLKVLPGNFEPQDYGIAFSSGSRLREPVNRELLKRLHDPWWQDLLYRYLGSQS